jgi:hypothetical protein
MRSWEKANQSSVRRTASRFAIKPSAGESHARNPEGAEKREEKCLDAGRNLGKPLLSIDDRITTGLQVHADGLAMHRSRTDSLAA